MGKRGALRVCYAYIEPVATAVLGLVYAKGESDDLTDKDKAALRATIERIENALLSRSYRYQPKSSGEDR